MQTSINLSIPFNSLVDAITSLSLDKRKELMELIEKQLNDDQQQRISEDSNPLEVFEHQKNQVIFSEEKQAVLVPLEEWQSIQETLYLNSIPSVVDDLIEGKNTPWEDCTPLEDLEW